MPLTLNVGLSRKTSQNYNSEGASINLTAELDQALLTRPDELQDKIADLYREAEVALARQQNTNTSDEPAPRPNGHNNGGGMTASQRRAIDAICERLNTNPVEEARHEFGLDLDRMTIREASKFIDHLKHLQPTGNGDHRHRNESRGRHHTPQGNRR